MKKYYLIVLLVLCTIFSFRKSDDRSAINYVEHIKPFIEKHCNNCHGGYTSYYAHGSNLNNYDSLKIRVNNGSLRQKVIVDKTMPAGIMWSVTPGLDSAELAMLDSWISAGAPYN